MDRLKDLLKARAQNPSVFITNQKPVLVITLAGAMNIGPAYNYTKRTNVLRITPEVGPQYLVQALDRPEMLMWINSLTLAAEAATNAKRRSGAMVEDSEETIDPQLLELPKELSSGNLVFGTSLEELARRDNATVPLIIEKCIAEVERRGLTEEGIYRVSPSAIHMQELRVAIDKGMPFIFFFIGDLTGGLQVVSIRSTLWTWATSTLSRVCSSFSCASSPTPSFPLATMTPSSRRWVRFVKHQITYLFFKYQHPRTRPTSSGASRRSSSSCPL